MRIYLDNCILNRPFDDQAQERIYLETQLLLILLKYIENNEIEFVISIANQYEVDKITDFNRKEKVKSYLDLAKKQINLNENIEKRALDLSQFGFMGMDALHVACAEAAKVDNFVTCDDQLLKASSKYSEGLKVKVCSIFKMIEDIHYVKNNE